MVHHALADATEHVHSKIVYDLQQMIVIHFVKVVDSLIKEHDRIRNQLTILCLWLARSHGIFCSVTRFTVNKSYEWLTASLGAFRVP